jgi:hypothetical protein
LKKSGPLCGAPTNSPQESRRRAFPAVLRCHKPGPRATRAHVPRARGSGIAFARFALSSVLSSAMHLVRRLASAPGLTAIPPRGRGPLRPASSCGPPRGVHHRPGRNLRSAQVGQ